MNFEPGEHHKLLKDALGQFLAQKYDFRERVAATRREPGYRADIWQALGRDLGILGAAVPEAFGGMGGGADDQLIVMEELGRALVVEPVAETAFQAAALLAKGGGAAAERLLAAIASGDARLAIAVFEAGMGDDLSGIAASATRTGEGWALSGAKTMVIAAPWASDLLIAARTSGTPGDAGGLSLFAVRADAPGLAMHAYSTIDERRAADLDLSGIPGELVGGEGDALVLLEEWRDRAIACLAAEAIGVLSRLLEDTTAYTKSREQFGKPIASFQALQHRMVDMWIELEMATAAAVLANLKLAAPAAERARAASAAKVTLARACRMIGQGAVQLHGGMGMTDELAVGHYFKRATMMEYLLGSTDWHLARRMAA